jgi:hypothetical protein
MSVHIGLIRDGRIVLAPSCDMIIGLNPRVDVVCEVLYNEGFP